jgi:hypothetical protein
MIGNFYDIFKHIDAMPLSEEADLILTHCWIQAKSGSLEFIFSSGPQSREKNSSLRISRTLLFLPSYFVNNALMEAEEVGGYREQQR